jgi:uncharacterized protein (DUF2336 family)
MRGTRAHRAEVSIVQLSWRRHPSAQRRVILASSCAVVYLARSERTDMNEMPNFRTLLGDPKAQGRQIAALLPTLEMM